MATPLLFDDAMAPFDLRPVFFALYPDAATMVRVTAQWDALRERLGLEARRVRNPHVTLFLVGPQEKLTRDRVAAAREAGDCLAAEPFELVFDQVVTFGGRRDDRSPIVMTARDGSPGCVAFQQRLGAAAQRAGAIRSIPGCLPHLTLAYDRGPAAPIGIEALRWTVREFTLTRSHPGEGIHERLANWPLGASGGRA